MAFTIGEIFTFANCSINSQNVVEGEQVLKSKQIILCGKIVKENEIQIKALVIQSSHIREMPHEITGKISTVPLLKIVTFACTCAAGLSECCKHIAAILLLLNRNSLDEIDTLSSTDIRCQWTKLREPSLEQFKPVPISKFCCVGNSIDCTLSQSKTSISFMKVVFLSSTYGTLYLMFYTFKTTYDYKYDRIRILYLTVPALFLSFFIAHVYTIIELLWTFSIVLESVAIVPQLLMLSRTSKDKSIISHYLFALGSYKALYILNWIYRYNESNFYDPIVIVAGIVETIITFCGYFSIFIEPKAKSGPIRVVVTDAAGQLAYSLIFKIANGEVFGTQQQVILHLIDEPSAMEVLEGVCMEIDDLALPLVQGYVKTTKLEVAFKNVDAAFLLGTMPNNESKEKKDFLSSNVNTFKLLGEALDKFASKDVKVLVVGNPANTNALICSLNAPSIPKENFTAMTRLDQNRAQSAIAIYLGLCVSNIKNVTIWGNQSSTQFPDVFNASVQSCDSSTSVYDVIKDTQWLEDDFIKIIQTREAAVIQARKKLSAMSAAKAAVDHMHDWWFGTADGTWVSMGVISDGSYGVPKDLIYSMPVTIYKKQWTIVQGLKITSIAKNKLDLAAKELLYEKEEALEVCNPSCVLLLPDCKT